MTIELDERYDARCLTTEAVKGASLALECVYNIKGGDGLSAGVLSVGDGVSDDVLKEDLKNTAGLLVDKTRDALDTTSASQTADSGLSDALDVVSQHLAVALGTTLTESLSSFSSSRHID
jgi:hypothetical protein